VSTSRPTDAPVQAQLFAWHGVDIESALPLDFAAGPTASGAFQRLRILSDAALGPAHGAYLRTSPHTGYALYRDPHAGCWLARDADRLHLTPATITVWPAALDPLRLEYLRTRALALWLHLIGVAPIHASAVSGASAALALVGRSGAGKSTLAAALVERGYAPCADDLLPLRVDDGEVPVHAGACQLGLWPHSAEQFHSRIDELPRVTPDSDKRRLRCGLASNPQVAPLKAIFLLERGGLDVAIDIQRLPSSKALLALLANGQMAGPAEALGLGASRLRVYAEALRSVSVYRLIYPADFSALPRVCEAIERTLQA